MSNSLIMNRRQFCSLQVSVVEVSFFLQECLIEDSEDSICTELDQALTALEQHLMVRSQGDGKIDRACARVRTAAAKFGPEQENVAALWVAEMRRNESVNPLALLEQQVALFGECLLDDDGGPERCKELNEALGALQVSLGIRGKIMPTRGLVSKT